VDSPPIEGSPSPWVGPLDDTSVTTESDLGFLKDKGDLDIVKEKSCDGNDDKNGRVSREAVTDPAPRFGGFGSGFGGCSVLSDAEKGTSRRRPWDR
jgi:hypothetical protein